MNNETSPGRRRAILLVLALSVLVVVMDMTILNVALSTIQRDFDASTADLQWSMDSYLITFAAFIFTGGVLADRFGRRSIVIASLAVFGGASLLAAMAGSIGELVAWRALMGIGAAAVPTVSLAILMVVFPPAERPKAIAAWAASAGVGTMIGPIVGGLLLQEFYWGSVLLINVPLAIAAVVAVALLVPESRNPNPGSFDPIGVLVSIAAVGTLVYGIVQGGEDSWLAFGTLGPIAGGLLLVVLLVLFERRVSTPALDLSLLKLGRYSSGTSAIALAFFALLGGIFVMSIYLQAVLGLSPAKAGLMMVPMGLAAFLISFRLPKLAMKFGPRNVVAAGTTLMAVAMLVFAALDADGPLWLVAVGQVALGLGWGCVMAPATGALMSVVPPVKMGAGQAVSNTVRQVAGALGVAVIGSVVSAVYRSSLGDKASALPANLADKARESVGGALEALRAGGNALGGADAQRIKDAAFDAHVTGMHAALLVCAGFAVLACVVAMRGLPASVPPPPGAPTPPPAPKPAEEATAA
ncbi:DHA2 family efflux MFS transporter permease subunit [Kitasatospora sp. NPDC049285]|uniref:DHA2 family efflux MFS transporter permease subunit n=1 Tax=Kitasatospora sp. NPDC049285 TaxID=3157096 RepID=UPI003445462B